MSNNPRHTQRIWLLVFTSLGWLVTIAYTAACALANIAIDKVNKSR